MPLKKTFPIDLCRQWKGPKFQFQFIKLFDNHVLTERLAEKCMKFSDNRPEYRKKFDRLLSANLVAVAFHFLPCLTVFEIGTRNSILNLFKSWSLSEEDAVNLQRLAESKFLSCSIKSGTSQNQVQLSKFVVQI